jgi:hypothetical protein
MKRLILGSVLGAFLLVGISAAMPVYQPVERTQATQTVQECPPPTDKGAYHSRGYDKDGNISCGFTYYNECPYFAGAEAGTPECEKGKPTPEQLEPWQPEQTNTAPVEVSECGGK